MNDNDSLEISHSERKWLLETARTFMIWLGHVSAAFMKAYPARK